VEEEENFLTTSESEMRSKLDERDQRFLLLFKLDAIRLFERVKFRRAEYVEIFALKRTRDHFEDIFYSRYKDANIHDLVHCGQDIIMAMDEFYGIIDNVKWYLDHTEDMPITVEETLEREIKKLERVLDKLTLYIDAELGVIKDSNNIEDLPSTPLPNE
jgi:hypothetical protein